MPNDKINSIIDLPAVQKEIDAFKKLIDEAINEGPVLRKFCTEQVIRLNAGKGLTSNAVITDAKILEKYILGI